MTAKSNRPPRNLSDIKTHAGRAGISDRSYANYFQMGALELERWRREREKEAATRRIDEINRRIGEIETEMSPLLEGVGLLKVESTVTSGANVLRNAAVASRRGVHFKY